MLRLFQSKSNTCICCSRKQKIKNATEQEMKELAYSDVLLA